MNDSTELENTGIQNLVSTEDLQPGTVIHERYLIKRKLGVGGMATVYLAEDTFQNSILVALKILKREFAKDKTYVERFCSEVIILSKLNHPNVIRFYDAGRDENTGFVYYVMEYVDGESLFDILQRKTFSSQEITKIILGICDGLNTIHRGQFIHRDIKPENILINTEGIIKISDFGVTLDVNVTRRLTTKLQKVGSMNYMAPEMWVGDKIAQTVDLYALGVILYQLTIGELPFKGATVREIMEQHLEEKVQFPEYVEISDWLKQLILKLLEKDPSKRIQSADDVVYFMLDHAEDDVKSDDITKGNGENSGKVYNQDASNSKNHTLCFRATRNIDLDELGLDSPSRRASVVIKLPLIKEEIFSIEIEKPSMDFLFLGLFLISLLAMDGILTSLGINDGNIHLEANPFVAYLMGVFGKNSALIMTKMVAILFVTFITVLAKRQRWIKNIIAALSCVYFVAAIVPWVFVLSYYN
jgi:serine/threonine protein kinase